MLGSEVFFSCTRLTDASQHDAYNAWHQLDHRPEVMTEPHVAASARWVRSPPLASATVTASDPLGELQYVTMYWYRQAGPFGRQAPQHFQLGRRADLEFSESLIAGMFVPIKGYVRPRLPVGPDVLPLRPARGVYLRIADHHGQSADLLRSFAWSDQYRLPDLVSIDGVAGAWVFADVAGIAASGSQPVRRVEIYYLDGDPLTVSTAIAQRDAALASESAGCWPTEGAALFEGPLATVMPWEWDWFDD